MKQYILHVLIALDQLVNALRGGSPDETLSAAAYRTELEGKILGKLFRPVIDVLFLPLEREHCYLSWKSEMTRQQLPVSYKVKSPPGS